MKHILTFSALLLAVLTGNAQTNRIERRSHGGGAYSFATVKTDNFGKIAPNYHYENKKTRVADTVRVIKVKPWRPVKDSVPPKVNPIYTKAKTAASSKSQGRTR